MNSSRGTATGEKSSSQGTTTGEKSSSRGKLKLKKVNVRLHEEDINLIKKMALEFGAPWQAYLRYWLHTHIRDDKLPRIA